MKSKSKKIFLFDVDGTLTSPLKKMSTDFAFFFLQWMSNKTVFLVGGSDYLKISRQVPSSILKRCAGVFCCMGNALIINDKIVYEKQWKPPIKLLERLLEIRKKSPYGNKRSKFIESRRGMINFSVAGRDSNDKEREHYSSWDDENKERQKISKKLNKEFPKLSICLGGMISLDIQPNGWDKSQAIGWLKKERLYEGGQMVFFGDKCTDRGNDESIYDRVKAEGGESFNVSGPKETIDILHSF